MRIKPTLQGFWENQIGLCENKCEVLIKTILEKIWTSQKCQKDKGYGNAPD